MKFIDLYAGIGGFRFALESLGHDCVFSAEKDKHAIETYIANFPSHNPSFDMNILESLSNSQIDKIIPDHDILCAGFPCQPFSIGGVKKGFSDFRGNQFFNILKILDAKKPKYIILENVKHLTTHDKGKTYEIIARELKMRGYDIGKEPTIMSPESIGIPHRRERSFMYATLNKKHKIIEIPEKMSFSNSIDIVFDFKIAKREYTYEIEIIEIWNELISKLKNKPPILWLDYLKNDDWKEEWPNWKKRYVEKMRNYYISNKMIFDNWIEKTKIMKTKNVKYRKFEWLAGDKLELNLKDKIITIRQSGVRVSKPNVFPTLVASVETPFVYDAFNKKFIKMSESEMRKLQSFPKNFIPNKNEYQSKKQLGNSVNVDVVKYIAERFIKWNS